MIPGRFFAEAIVSRKGIVIHIRSREGGLMESNSVEANLLFEILQQLKNEKR